MTKIVVYSGGNQQLLYYPNFFDQTYFELLQQTLPWQQNEIRVFGKLHKEPRLTCWFGPAYTYSSIHWPQNKFPVVLDEIKMKLNGVADFSFNAVLANYYRNGNDSMGWHKDNEPEMDKSLIASATFGGKRVFKMRNVATGQKIDLELDDSSLLLMSHMQDEWQHAIPKSKTRNAPRINLTFRRIIELDE
jgi:alkylated DNA repair dioxygenase AlkB